MNRLSIFIGLFEEEEENSDVVFHFLFCSFVYDCTFRKKRIGWITLSKSHSYRCAHALILSPSFFSVPVQASANKQRLSVFIFAYLHTIWSLSGPVSFHCLFHFYFRKFTILRKCFYTFCTQFFFSLVRCYYCFAFGWEWT